MTGTGEKLGVVVWQNSADVPNDVSPEVTATRWGADPLWSSQAGSLVPLAGDFESYDDVVSIQLVDPSSLKQLNYSLVLFEPKHDLASDMWYVDVHFKKAPSYFSFLQLSLVRYQKYAIDGCQASPICLAPIIQLLPDRILSVQLQGATLKVRLADPISKARVADGSKCVMAVQRPWLTAIRREDWKQPH